MIYGWVRDEHWIFGGNEGSAKLATVNGRSAAAIVDTPCDALLVTSRPRRSTYSCRFE